jgi:hypothetical protein
MDECVKRLHELTEQAKVAAGIPADQKLFSLVPGGHAFSFFFFFVCVFVVRVVVDQRGGSQGMSLSGADKAEARTAITSGLADKYPHTAEHFHVCTDTFGGLYTACADGLSCSVAVYQPFFELT